MPMTWATVCRKANGEKLVESRGQLVTRTRAFLDRQTFPLLHLNWDCRSAILEEILPPTTYAFFLRGTNGRPRTGIPFPQITSTNKQLRAESVYIVLNQTEIEIHSGPGNEAFQKWMSSLDLTSLQGDVGADISTGFDAVHRLSFPYFSRFPHRTKPADTPNADIELVLKCPRLQEIKLHFVVDETWDYNLQRQKTALLLRQEYRLDGLLQLAKLEKITLQHGFISGDETQGAGALAKWLREEFEKLGRVVQIVA